MDLVQTDVATDRWVLRGLDRLIEALVGRFDEVIGPVVLDGVVRLQPIESADDLPIGIADEQAPATYRLRRDASALRFSYGLGPDSLKSLVHPPRSPVWTMRRRDGSLVVDAAHHPTHERAVIGARACDIDGLRVLERTQTGGDHADPAFRANRNGLFVVAVDCTHPAPTCFCANTGTGPSARDGHDIAMTELETRDGAVYVLRAGSERGRALIDELQLERASSELIRRAAREPGVAARGQPRSLPANAPLIAKLAEHPQWDDVAERCLACGNCTAVCPTCFCTDMEDVVSLDGDGATRVRVWDTCFSMEFSRVGPAPIRGSVTERYRQWLSHKLGTWHDQFGESGCVGCGRCITWCPVGIDLTAEIAALAAPAEAAR